LCVGMGAAVEGRKGGKGMGGRRTLAVLMLALAVFAGTCAGAEGFRQEQVSLDWAEVGGFSASADHP